MGAEVSRGVSLMVMILTCVGGSLGPCEDSLIADVWLNQSLGWMGAPGRFLYGDSWVNELKADT